MDRIWSRNVLLLQKNLQKEQKEQFQMVSHCSHGFSPKTNQRLFVENEFFKWRKGWFCPCWNVEKVDFVESAFFELFSGERERKGRGEREREREKRAQKICFLHYMYPPTQQTHGMQQQALGSNHWWSIRFQRNNRIDRSDRTMIERWSNDQSDQLREG